MIYTGIIEGEKCTLKYTDYSSESGCLEKYVEWMNDDSVTKYLYSRSTHYDQKSLLEYVEAIKTSDSIYMFGIYENEKYNYIGNIKIGPIQSMFRFADIGYMIGEKDYWNKGFATEAIELICRFGFEVLDLHRITSGCNEHNIGSQKALLNNGFQLEGVLREHELMENEGYTNKNIYGLLKDEYKKLRSRRTEYRKGEKWGKVKSYINMQKQLFREEHNY